MQTRNPNNPKIIDISHHQKNINWPEVKTSGIKGVLIKATEGVGYVDDMFHSHVAGAESIGLKIGMYHYARPETPNSARDEAENFLNAIEGIPARLPYALDLEGHSDDIGNSKMAAWAYQWLSIVQERCDHPVMLYVNINFAAKCAGSKLGAFPLWIAYPHSNQPPDVPLWDRWSVFQYDWHGYVPGIPGNVDMNEMEMSYWMELTQKQSFPDVAKGAWYAGAIDAVSKAGLMNGFPDGTFKPEDPVTRGQLASVLARLAEKGISIRVHN